MRVLVDTKVFVASFYGGDPREIIRLWSRSEITLCLSAEIVDEYVRVLQDLGMEADRELGEILSLLARGHSALFAADTPDLKIVKSDPDDDRFFECAVALDAQIIISGDKAVLSVNDYMGTKSMTPRQFLELYNAQ